MKTLILAGGRGTRLWPLSRNQKPKQFQRLISQKTMLQETVGRLMFQAKWLDIFVSTNQQYLSEVKQELSKLPLKNIILEPASRERLAAILLFLAFLSKKYYHRPILITPSDHVVRQTDIFQRAVLAGEQFIKQHPDYILILGAEPTFPDTGLGYIKTGEKLVTVDGFNINQVAFFKEKPNLKRTKEFLKEGGYLWNTAIYIIMPTLIKKLVQKFVPDSFKRYQKIAKAVGRAGYTAVLEKEYTAMDKASLEYSIIENYPKVASVGCNFGWSDVGSWSVLKDTLTEPNKSFAIGNHIDIGSKNVMVYGSFDKLVASVGVKDLIIVVTDDIILVCNKKESQKVKQIIEKLEQDKKFDYLWDN